MHGGELSTAAASTLRHHYERRTARGEDEPSSDIDVVLVSARNKPSRQADAVRERITAALPESGHKVSLVALGPDDVRRLASEGAEFWRGLERDAVVLVGDAPIGVLESLAGRKAHS